MSQESLASGNTNPQKAQELPKVNTTTPQPMPAHNDQCCNGSCEISWKPVKITKR
jgi:hypothetical protein